MVGRGVGTSVGESDVAQVRRHVGGVADEGLAVETQLRAGEDAQSTARVHIDVKVLLADVERGRERMHAIRKSNLVY